MFKVSLSHEDSERRVKSRWRSLFSQKKFLQLTTECQEIKTFKYLSFVYHSCLFVVCYFFLLSVVCCLLLIVCYCCCCFTIVVNLIPSKSKFFAKARQSARKLSFFAVCPGEVLTMNPRINWRLSPVSWIKLLLASAEKLGFCCCNIKIGCSPLVCLMTST